MGHLLMMVFMNCVITGPSSDDGVHELLSLGHLLMMVFMNCYHWAIFR